ncbi:MAG TPA: putative toxin-antitoxin system toxin component, PIN family [Candidatus Nanoarchaeia archaeon]|nr:putative toxin-antitoxin system toxin component, PIN family [Candidatus Nanoarchaeia archaeon]
MSQEKVKVVLDTNIIISAAISSDGNPAKIFELLLKDEIVNYVTYEILDEIKKVIERPLFKKYIGADYKKFIMDNLIDKSVLTKSSFDENAVLNDEEDNKFINCALSIKSIIISGDNHLLSLKNYKGVRILSPKEFLEEFY